MVIVAATAIKCTRESFVWDPRKSLTLFGFIFYFCTTKAVWLIQHFISTPLASSASASSSWLNCVTSDSNCSLIFCLEPLPWSAWLLANEAHIQLVFNCFELNYWSLKRSLRLLVFAYWNGSPRSSDIPSDTRTIASESKSNPPAVLMALNTIMPFEP